MIDDKKIEEAAYRFATSQTHGELLALIDGYKEGFKDAINESLKDLWHETDEKPVPIMGCNNGVLVELNEVRKPITLWKREYLYENISKHGNRFVSRWLDINDLLKGGRQ